MVSIFTFLFLLSFSFSSSRFLFSVRYRYRCLKSRRLSSIVGLLLEGREAVGDGLAVLVLGVLFQSRGLCGLEEGRFADLALNVASLFVHLELGLGSVLVLSSALALLLSLGTVTHDCDLVWLKEE
jgi:hypothetical protein